MNTHQNARLTPAGRALLVHRILVRGEAVPTVAQGLGVSRRTVYKWLRRWHEGGRAGLADRSSRPQHSPRRLARPLRRRIRQLRLQRWSALRIATHLALPVSTVVVTQRRLGLARLRALAPPVPVVRYERARPGELVHLDIKKLGRIGRVGHRIHGDHARRTRGIGWEYLHVCIDDATRLAYTEVLADECGATTAGFLRRAAAWLLAQGVPRLERVMTDNGSGYVAHTFRDTVRDLGARHLRTRPYTPRTNGKAERWIQTLLREWAYARPYASSARRLAALPRWLEYYNTERPHTALGYRPPQHRLQALVNNVFVNDT